MNSEVLLDEAITAMRKLYEKMAFQENSSTEIQEFNEVYKKLSNERERFKMQHINESESQLSAETLLGIIAHEIRSSMLVLATGLESVEDELIELVPNSENLKIIATLRKRITETQSTLNFYLENFKLENEVSIALNSFDAKNIEEQILETLHSFVKNDKFSTSIQSNLILGNEVGTRQVILNLVRNAIFACRSANRGEVLFCGEKIGNSYIFSVVDTAACLKKEDAERIFKKYVSERRNGIGLGLYVSREICRKMGGDLKVEIKKGVSTKFEFSLPVVV